MIFNAVGRFVWLAVDIRNLLGIIDINKIFLINAVNNNPENCRFIIQKLSKLSKPRSRLS
jgi:hypothetical protein